MNAESKKTVGLLSASFWNGLLFLSAGSWLLVLELIFMDDRFLFLKELAVPTAASFAACGLLLTLWVAFIQHIVDHEYHLSLYFFGVSLDRVRRMTFCALPPVAIVCFAIAFVRFVARLSAARPE
jgi:hypothetical protein